MSRPRNTRHSRTIRLESGGEVTIVLSVANLLQMSKMDRDFVASLLKSLDRYDNDHKQERFLEIKRGRDEGWP